MSFCAIFQDLLERFELEARKIQAEIRAKRNAVRCLSSHDARTLKAIEQRLEAMEREEKNVDFTIEQGLENG